MTVNPWNIKHITFTSHYTEPAWWHELEDDQGAEIEFTEQLTYTPAELAHHNR